MSPHSVTKRYPDSPTCRLPLCSAPNTKPLLQVNPGCQQTRNEGTTTDKNHNPDYPINACLLSTLETTRCYYLMPVLLPAVTQQTRLHRFDHPPTSKSKMCSSNWSVALRCHPNIHSQCILCHRPLGAPQPPHHRQIQARSGPQPMAHLHNQHVQRGSSIKKTVGHVCVGDLGIWNHVKR